MNAIEAMQQSYHPDVTCTNSNPQLNLGFVPFGRQPPRSPGQRVLKKAKQMQEQTHFDNAPFSFSTCFSPPLLALQLCPLPTMDAGSGGAVAASSPGSGLVADLCLPQAAGLSQASMHRHHYS